VVSEVKIETEIEVEIEVETEVETETETKLFNALNSNLILISFHTINPFDDIHNF
jgi:hypothetical protein